VSREFIVRLEAEDDITDAAVWYEQQSPGLGWDFTRVVDACLTEVSRKPMRFPVVRKNARRAILRRFPFAVIFVVDDARVEVIACLHARRDPVEWARRLPSDR
jgi:plasmid stabilization system protein ParE